MGQGEATVDREPLDFHVQEKEWKFPDLGAPSGNVKDRGSHITHQAQASQDLFGEPWELNNSHTASAPLPAIPTVTQD